MSFSTHLTRARAWALTATCGAGLVLTHSNTARADATFGPLVLAESVGSGGGSYLTGFTTTTSPNAFTLTLPNFNIGDLDAGSLTIELTITTPPAEPIFGSNYSILGAFTGDGSAAGTIQLSDLSTPANVSMLDTLNLPPDAAGSLLLASPTHSASLSLTLNLDTNGANVSSAGVRTISFTLQSVPETGTYLAGALCLGFAAWSFRRRSQKHATAALLAGTLLSMQVSAASVRSEGTSASKSQISNRSPGVLRSPPVATAAATPTKGQTVNGAASPMTEYARIARAWATQIGLGRVAHVVGNKIIFAAPNTTGADPLNDGGDDGDIYDPDNVFPVPGGQAEYSLAVDSTGQHVVIGFNDTRGFSRSPVSVSGFYYSDDGGTTFVDGGQMPVNFGGTTTISGTVYPQIFGDTDVKYAGGNNFIMSSIMVKAISASGVAQTLCIHRSVDNGHTWTGPFEVTAATNPTGVFSGSNARDAADKEFIDIDPSTGRVLVAWVNFEAAQSIRASVCDNAFSATPPTWTTSAIVSPSGTGGPSGAMPRFKGDGTKAYLVFNDRGRAATDPSGYPLNNEKFSKSADNGLTWSAPALLTSDFRMLDSILGNDRVHSFPFMAVDQSAGPNAGNIYIVYASNANLDGSDIAFQRSTDGGTSFSAPILVNSRPGSDRSQWFPTICVDKNSGRIFVTFYDQGIATSGDLMEISTVSSADGGLTFTKPAPLSPAPFHAGWGNDTGQPNLGDYNMSVAQGGELFAVHAFTQLPGYSDGQPTSPSLNTPDAFFTRTPLVATPSLRPGSITFTETGGNGFIDAGDQVQLTVPLSNYVTNPALSPATATGVSATMSSSTPGVTFVRSSSTYPDIVAGGTENNSAVFVAKLTPSFVPGTPISYTLTVVANGGSKTFKASLSTGTPSPATLLAENFDSTAAGSLPAGWSTVHGGGTTTVPWTTSATAFRPTGSPNNAAFHVNANDAANPTRFERLFSPLFVVPSGIDYVTIDMDVAYNTEDDPSYNILAYDGFCLRITDQTSGRLLRSILLEAVAQEFTTGASQHYQKELPRNNSAAYFQDMSVWGGFSNGFKHVRAKIPAAGLSGSTIQLRFEFTQDSFGTAFDVRPQNPADPALATSGVVFDNLVVAAVSSFSVELAALKLTPVAGSPGSFTGVVTSQALAPTGGIAVALSTLSGFVTLPPSVTIPAGASASPVFSVTVASGGFNTSISIKATGPTVGTTPGNSRTAVVRVRNP